MGLKYKNMRCGMIVHDTATHQSTLEFKLLQVPLWPSIMNQNPYHNVSCKRPRNTKSETIQNGEQITINVWLNNDKRHTRKTETVRRYNKTWDVRYIKETTTDVSLTIYSWDNHSCEFEDSRPTSS